MYAHMDMWDGFILYLQYQNSASLLQKGGLWGLLQAILLHLDTISLYDTCVFLCEYSLEMNETLRALKKLYTSGQGAHQRPLGCPGEHSHAHCRCH